MRWVAKSGDGPVTITISWGGNGTGFIVLKEVLPDDSAPPLGEAAGPADRLVYEYAGGPGMHFMRADVQAAGGTPEACTAWIKVEQNGKVLAVFGDTAKPGPRKLGTGERGKTTLLEFDIQFQVPGHTS